ncbi:hypothetical protein CDAR_383021, partial [Caerostris darwini]
LKKKRDRERKTGRKSRCERSAPAMRAPLALRGGLLLRGKQPDRAVANGRRSHFRKRPTISAHVRPGVKLGEVVT